MVVNMLPKCINNLSITFTIKPIATIAIATTETAKVTETKNLPKFGTNIERKLNNRGANIRIKRGWRENFYTIINIRDFLFVLIGIAIATAPLCCQGEKDFNFNDSGQVTLIEPKDEPVLYKDIQDPYTVELSQCRYGNDEIVLSLIFKDYNWHGLNEARKLRTLKRLSRFFAISQNYITKDSMTKHSLYEMQKRSLKRGNNKCHVKKNHWKLGRVNFIIGCGVSYFSVSEPIVNQIGQQMKDGSLDNIIGEEFCWWIIWRRPYKPFKILRQRREIEGSGGDDDDDYNDDNYDYDDDEDDNIENTATEVPTSTTQNNVHRHRHDSIIGSQLINNNNNNNNELLLSNKIKSTDEINILNKKFVNRIYNNNNNNNKNDDNDNYYINNGIIKLNMKNKYNDQINIKLPDINSKIMNIVVDDEIKESVSELESVITKTIENTENLSNDVTAIIHPFMEQNNEYQYEHQQHKQYNEVKETSQMENGEMIVETIVTDGSIISTTIPATSAITEITSTTVNDASLTKKIMYEDNDINSIKTGKKTTTQYTSVNDIIMQSMPLSNVITGKKPYQFIDTIITPSSLLSSSLSSQSLLSKPSSIKFSNMTESFSSTAKIIQTKEDLRNIDAAPTYATEKGLHKITFTSTPHNDIDNNYSSTVPWISSLDPIMSSDFNVTTDSQESAIMTTPMLSHSTTSSATIKGTMTSTTTTTTTSTIIPEIINDTNTTTITITTTTTTPSQLPPASSTTATATTAIISPTKVATTTPTTAATTTTAAPAGGGTMEASSIQSITVTPTTPTTTTILTDIIAPKFENTPPLIKTRLQKMAVTSGKSFKFLIPNDTFYDNEDKTNLRLDITDQNGHELKENFWLQFNTETREVYGLPLDDAVSKWQYRLTATDSGNESVTEIFEITVQQHRGVRSINHEINIAVKINEKNIHFIDWQLRLINAIAVTMDDSNTNSIVVKEIRQTAHDPNGATLIYFNETLPTAVCPEMELNTLVKRLDANRLSDLVYPMLGIKSITGQLIGPCQKTMTHKPNIPSIATKNSPPIPRNQVDRVVATTGHLLVYKVPADTFFDANDNALKLTLKTKDNKELNPRHWLQFDTKNQEFYGIPKSGDMGSEEYLLVAEDYGGLTAADALVVQVNNAPKREFLVYFKIYLGIRHELFNADLQRKFVERIAQLFGDDSPQYIQIRSVTTHHDADGTIVNFYNTTMYKTHNRCPENEIEAIRNVYLDGQTVRHRVRKILGPELNVTNVQVTTLGVCNPQNEITHREFMPNHTEEPLLKSTFSDGYMFTIILPAIIIVTMILVAGLVACCLHQRRRKSGKMELGDEDERKSFKTKGIPVIFQDELEEKPEIGNKSPIILKDEKPPLLPPSYNTSTTINDDDVDEYAPPPAVMMDSGGSSGRASRGKSPLTPSYRKPPSYVSP